MIVRQLNDRGKIIGIMSLNSFLCSLCSSESCTLEFYNIHDARRLFRILQLCPRTQVSTHVSVLDVTLIVVLHCCMYYGLYERLVYVVRWFAA